MTTIFYYPNTNTAGYITDFKDGDLKNVKISRDGNTLRIIDIDKGTILLETNNFVLISNHDEPGSNL